VAEALGRVLALDLGQVRIGMALSDPLGITVNPLPPHVCRGARPDLEHVAGVVRSRGVTRVVVGLPLLMSGEDGEAAVAARRFAARLRGRIGEIEVELWDERLTTVQAERTLIAADVRRDKRRKVIDGLAAAIILQNYLDSRP
jgi:putative Holliday junction resolvase